MKIKGIRNTVGEWNNQPNAVRVYFDKNNLEVWACVYPSLSSWDNYNDSNIIEVACKDNAPFGDSKLTMADLKERCENVLRIDVYA